MGRSRKRLIAGVLVLLIFAAVRLSGLLVNDSSLRMGSDAMREFTDPVVVGFPLRGEWMAPTTPARRIPSHGTDLLGERYALDFLQVDWERTGRPFYRTGVLRYLFTGVPLSDCYGWGEEIYAPCDGVVVCAEDGYRERSVVQFTTDLLAALKSARAVRQDDLQAVTGNYVILQCSDQVYAAFAHLQMGSVLVTPGQAVKKNDVLGRVGHSGNSMAPHLHFQLMDSSNLATARGTPCVFEQYEVYRDGEWKPVYHDVPSSKERIRFNLER